MAERLQVEPFEDIQHFERSHPLSIRRQLHDLIAAICRHHGIDPVRVMLGKVRGCDQTLPPLHVLGNRLRNRAFIERVASFLGDELQRPGQRRISEYVPARRRLASGQIH